MICCPVWKDSHAFIRERVEKVNTCDKEINDSEFHENPVLIELTCSVRDQGDRQSSEYRKEFYDRMVKQIILPCNKEQCDENHYVNSTNELFNGDFLSPPRIRQFKVQKKTKQ